MDTPSVSVIIPAYNASGFIREALDSVASQTFSDFEIVVVDDGSIDHTSDIVRAEYPEVRCLRVENGGPARARNIGIRESRSRFIAFLDADDVWLPQKLEKQVASMTSDETLGMTFTEASIFDDSGTLSMRLNKEGLLMHGDLVRNIFEKSHLGTSTVMIRRAVLDRVGQFEEGLICGEDDNLWMRVAMYARVQLIDEPLVRARRRDGSLSRTGETLFAGMDAHLLLLETKYPELRARLGELIDKKRSVLNFQRGLAAIAADDSIRARAEFTQSLRYRHTNLRAALYWLATLLPPSLYPGIRTVKRLIARTLRKQRDFFYAATFGKKGRST